MVVRIGSNIASLSAQRSLTKVSEELSLSFERLSSGMRINRASDDAAGLAIASGLNADSRIYTQGIRNLNDGISALSIGEGALRQLSNVVTRQLELAEQAANGVYGSQQRSALNTEVNALVNEFNRIVAGTQFNGRNLLDRSYLNTALQAGSGSGSILSIGIGNEFGRSIGTGRFQASSSINFGNDVDDVALADFNGDGILDMVSGSSTVGIAIGNGDGTFQAIQNYGTSTSFEFDKTLAGDFNGDGKKDVAFRDFTTGDLAIYLGNGDGTFRNGVTLDETASEGAFFLGDVNGDGRDDILVQNGAAANTIRLANSDGSFASALTVTITGLGSGATFGDFNGDGKLDLILNRSGASSAVLFTGNGDGTFNATLTIGSASNGGYGLASGDFNNDGKLDFVVGDVAGNNLNIFLGNGNGTFQSKKTIDVGRVMGAYDVIIADMNNDGFDDIFVGGAAASSGVASTVLSNGDGTFASPISYNTGITVLNAVLGDLNGDGVLDIASQNAGGSDNTARVALAQTDLTSNQSLFNLKTREKSLYALTFLRRDLARITSELGAIGAHQSRLSVAIKNLDVGRENFEAARSRIVDSDIAQEAANNIRLSILQKVGAQILEQANLQPQIALKLIQG